MTKKKLKKDLKKAGAPTKYRPEYATMILEFMAKPMQEIKVDRTYYDVKGLTFSEIDGFSDDGDGIKRGMLKKEEHVVFAHVFPTLERFAYSIGVDRGTMEDWSKITYPDNYKEVKLRGQLKFPEFNRAYTRAIQIQESLLMENTLSGQYNAQFAIFLAKNKFGWKDKTETDLNHSGSLEFTGVDIL